LHPQITYSTKVEQATYFTKTEVHLALQVVTDKGSLQFSSSASGNKRKVYSL